MYFTIGIEKKRDGQPAVNVYPFATKGEAGGKFYQILSEAAPRNPLVFTAFVVNEYGAMIQRPESIKNEDDESQE